MQGFCTLRKTVWQTYNTCGRKPGRGGAYRLLDPVGADDIKHREKVGNVARGLNPPPSTHTLMCVLCVNSITNL